MKKLIVLSQFLLLGLVGASQITITFNLTLVNNGGNGEIEARISGAGEAPDVECLKGANQEHIPIHNMYLDPETDEYVVEVIDLDEEDYLFRINGGEYEETVHLASASQTNPLSFSFTNQNQLGSNLGSITAVITTGSTAPTVTCLDQKNDSVPISTSSFDSQNNTLSLTINNLPAGEYTFEANDGTFYQADTTSVQYQVSNLSIEYFVKHVSNSADGELTAVIAGGTDISVVSLSKHGDTSTIYFSSVFNPATFKKTIVANNVEEGVYELHASESGFDVYSYVWIGKYGATTTLSTQPDANYGIDAMLYKDLRPWQSHSVNTNYGTNYTAVLLMAGTSSGYLKYARNLIKFNYFGLEDATITNAEMTLYGYYYRNQGSGGGNEFYLRRVENGYSWDENTVTWNTQPITTSSNEVTIPAQGITGSAATANFTKVADITNLVTDQLASGNENNGFLMELLNENVYRYQIFRSSDYTVSSEKPKLTLSFTLPEEKQFVKLKKKLDGGFVKLDDRRLRFIYGEEYNDQDEKLTYKIYNERHEVVMGDVTNTSIPASSRLDVTDVHYGQNRISLNIDCCLPCDKFFILEVTNEKNEKWYLRFKTAASVGGESQCHPCGSQIGCAVSSGGSGS